MDLRIFITLACVLFFSVACGGGGGSSGAGGGSGAIPDYMSFDVSMAVATNVEGGVSNGASVVGTLSQAGQNQFSAGDTIYIVITSNASAITDIDVDIVGNQGFAQINVDNALSVGTYSGNLNVRVCKDSSCSNVVSSSDLPFQYDVLEPAVDVSDALQLGFVQYQDQALPSDSTTYDFSSFDNLVGSPNIYLNLDTNDQVGDSDEDSSWVDLRVDANLRTITATARDSRLPCGRTNGEVIVFYRTLDWEHKARIPIEYTIDSLPVVHAVHPKVVYGGNAANVIVTGCGFNSINAADLRIDGIAPQSATVVSDREMIVRLPVGLADGYHDLFFTSSAVPAGSPTQQLLIRQGGTRPNLDFNFMAQRLSRVELTVWDEERERLIVADTNALAMFENTGTEWQYSQISGVSDNDGDAVILSANGNNLVRISSSGGFRQGVAVYDADTLTFQRGGVLQDTRREKAAIDKFERLYVSPRDARPSNYAVFTDDGLLLSVDRADAFNTVNRSKSFTSGNQDVVLVSTLVDNGWFRIDTTDMSEQFQPHTGSAVDVRDAWVSFSGAYAEIRNNGLGNDRAIFDDNFDFVGRIPSNAVLDDQTPVIRTPGLWIDEESNTAIASFSEPTQPGVAATRVRYELYDLTAASNDPFTATSSFEVTGLFNPGIDDKEENYFFVSQDGETIFRIGDRITIMPNPF